MGKELSKGRRGSSASNEEFTLEDDIQNILNSITRKKFGEKALDILKMASYFTSSIIEKGIFLSLLSNEQELREVLKLLEKYNLIDIYWETGVFSVPENVRERVKSYLLEEKQEESVLRNAFTFFSESPKPDEIVVHINSVLGFAKRYPNLLEENSSALSGILKGLGTSKSSAEAFLLGSQAFEALKEALGEYNTATLTLQMELVKLAVLHDDFDTATKLATGLYEKESRVAGKKTVSPTLKVVAQLKLRAEDKAESERQLRELVFGGLPVSQTKNNSVLGEWDQYAFILLRADLVDEALEIFQELLKRRCDLLDPDDDDIDEVNTSLVAVHLKKKENDKALDLAKSVRERRQARYGDFSVKTIATSEVVGQIHVGMEKYEDALGIYKDVVEKLRCVTGKSSLYYNALSQLGRLCFILDDYEKAYEINSELYEKRKATNGEEDDVCFSLQKNMLSCLIGQGKTSEAAQHYKEVLEHCIETFGFLHWKTLKWYIISDSGEGLSYTFCET